MEGILCFLILTCNSLSAGLYCIEKPPMDKINSFCLHFNAYITFVLSFRRSWNDTFILLAYFALFQKNGKKITIFLSQYEQENVMG